MPASEPILISKILINGFFSRLIRAETVGEGYFAAIFQFGLDVLDVVVSTISLAVCDCVLIPWIRTALPV